MKFIRIKWVLPITTLNEIQGSDGRPIDTQERLQMFLNQIGKIISDACADYISDLDISNDKTWLLESAVNTTGKNVPSYNNGKDIFFEIQRLPTPDAVDVNHLNQAIVAKLYKEMRLRADCYQLIMN